MDNPKSEHNGERRAESTAYRPPKRQKLQRLIDLATRRIAVAQNRLPVAALIIPSGQIEIVLDRIAAGGGAPVPLPQIQHGPCGTFISQLPPRTFELKRRYGFVIRQRQEQEKSWYWLQLDSTGTKPEMRAVTCAPVKNGKPAPRTASMEVSSNENNCQQTTTSAPVPQPPRQQMQVSPPATSPQQPEQGAMFSSSNFVEHETGTADHKRRRK